MARRPSVTAPVGAAIYHYAPPPLREISTFPCAAQRKLTKYTTRADASALHTARYSAPASSCRHASSRDSANHLFCKIPLRCAGKKKRGNATGAAVIARHAASLLRAGL